MLVRLIAFAGLAVLSACGPVPLVLAEQQCLQAAREARGPTGTAGVGLISSDGTARLRSKLDVTLSSDWVTGRDPSTAYEACVVSKSGQAPSRPLSQRSDWKG